MKIVECLWKEQFVEKLERKHQVSTDEVEEIFRNAPRFKLIAKGLIAGENVYRALGQTDDGRYLAVFFIYKHGGKALPISARDMDTKERRSYGKKEKEKARPVAGRVSELGRSGRILGHAQQQ